MNLFELKIAAEEIEAWLSFEELEDSIVHKYISNRDEVPSYNDRLKIVTAVLEAIRKSGKYELTAVSGHVGPW